MTNYAPALPRDKNDEVKQNCVPPKLALTRFSRDNASASSILLLGHDTTEIEIGAITTAAALKWMTQAVIDSSVAATSVITAAGSANYDHLIAPNTVERVIVPIASNPQTTSIQGVNRQLGLYTAVAIKSTGVGSVLTAEF